MWGCPVQNVAVLLRQGAGAGVVGEARSRVGKDEVVPVSYTHLQMIVAGDRVGVAVSGGADSVALLLLLEDLQNELGVGLCVLHLDHGLRGQASDTDAAFVADLARAHALELCSAHEDVAAEAKRNHWNLEDAGRRARNSFFERAVSQGHCTRVAVAHTADDQAETVLARIVRGTGPRGIVGIYPVRGSIVRPLLDVRRADLREYLGMKRQDWREDATNRDTTRLRARLRHELLPLLERDFNPAIVDRLSSLSAIFRDEEVFWKLIVEEMCIRDRRSNARRWVACGRRVRRLQQGSR